MGRAAGTAGSLQAAVEVASTNVHHCGLVAGIGRHRHLQYYDEPELHGCSQHGAIDQFRLGQNVNLNNTGNYSMGRRSRRARPETWFASGSVSLVDTAGAASFACKAVGRHHRGFVDGGRLWRVPARTSNISLSGYLATPAGNLRISCTDSTSTSGVISFNNSGNSKDATISAFRIHMP